MFNKVNNLIKNKDLTISNLLFYNINKLNINYEELYYLIYLFNTNSMDFDISRMCKDLDKKPKDLVKVINSLSEKGLIDLEVDKSNNDIKEIISLDKLYEKLTFLIVEEENEVPAGIDLVKEFSIVFKRDITAREKQIINTWKSIGYNDEFVLEGLKEAKYNGEFSFSYIDVILDKWTTLGFTTKEDVIKSKTIDISNPINEEPVIDMDDDYDWMNE